MFKKLIELSCELDARIEIRADHAYHIGGLIVIELQRCRPEHRLFNLRIVLSSEEVLQAKHDEEIIIDRIRHAWRESA